MMWPTLVLLEIWRKLMAMKLKDRGMNIFGINRVGGFATLAVVLGLALILTACGDDKKAQKAAKWLKGDAQVNPPNGGEWISTSVTVDENGRIVMDVLVPNPDHVNIIKSRKKIEQVNVLMLACPHKVSKFWSMIDADQELWINLTGRTSAGLDEVLQGASCKYGGYK